MADVIYDKIELLLQNVSQQIKRDGCAEMRLNWLAFNLDSLTDWFFDRGMDLLMDEKKSRAWSETVNAVATSTPFAKQFTWFIPLAKKLPMWLLEKATPEISRVIKLQTVSFGILDIGVSRVPARLTRVSTGFGRSSHRSRKTSFAGYD